jgi:hypothetical protein
LYIDLTVLPKGSFQQAIARAQSWLKKTPPESVLTIDVASARRMGLYPLPTDIAPERPAAKQTQTGSAF